MRKQRFKLSRVTLVVFRASFTAATALAFASPIATYAQTDNTGYGAGVLSSLTTGSGNSAFGFEALSNDTTGNYNTALGGGALVSNTTGVGNTATGANALAANTASYNTATGFLSSNSTPAEH